MMANPSWWHYPDCTLMSMKFLVEHGAHWIKPVRSSALQDTGWLLSHILIVSALVIMEMSFHESVDQMGDVKIIHHRSDSRRVMEEHPHCCFSLIASANGSLIKLLNRSNGITADWMALARPSKDDTSCLVIHFLSVSLPPSFSIVSFHLSQAHIFLFPLRPSVCSLPLFQSSFSFLQLSFSHNISFLSYLHLSLFILLSNSFSFLSSLSNFAFTLQGPLVVMWILT